VSVYSVVPKDVVSEIIDGEAVIMDLRTGIYFSMDGVGGIVWDGILAGHDTAAIVARIQAATGAPVGQVADDLDAIIADLVAQNLVHQTAAPSAPADWAIPLPSTPHPYLPPHLARHGDMQELAALDPIHDVEETGWPNRRTSY